MSVVTALLWDIGGVILTNGWGRDSRMAAVERFHLDLDEFRERHELANPGFEMGRLSLNEYLQRTVFYRPRPFAMDDFKTFMFEQSRELPGARAVLDAVTRSGEYLMVAVNNEGRELNEFRIDRFALRRNFTAFFTSCYTGVRKPDEAILRLTLEVTRRAPQECIFIDDRAINVENAASLGMQTIQFRNAAQLKEELMRLGVAS